MGLPAPSNEPQPLTEVSFVCGCKHKFKAVHGRADPAPDRPFHPFDYFAKCPECGEEAQQAAWERNILKAWSNATGPITEAGKEASAANLDGHPTPEETVTTRFNAMKHGLFARVATHFPARPGGYQQCKGCEYEHNQGCKEFNACTRRTELYLKHQIAFQTRDPGLLMGLRANTHAAIQGLIDDMILAITQTGAEFKNPVYGFDKDGRFNIGTYTDPETRERKTIMEVHAHPLMKILGDWISKTNMGLDDMGMTPKSVNQQDALEGYLSKQSQDQVGEEEYRQQNKDQMDNLAVMIKNSQRQISKDPILVEHRRVDEDE